MQQKEARNEKRDLFFGIISQKELEWSEHNAVILEIAEDGVMIETREPVGPGFVWFCQKIRGNRGGFLEWSTRAEVGYSAKIRFVPLSWNVEHYVLERARRSRAHIPLRDPAEILDPHLVYPKKLRNTDAAPDS